VGIAARFAQPSRNRRNDYSRPRWSPRTSARPFGDASEAISGSGSLDRPVCARWTPPVWVLRAYRRDDAQERRLSSRHGYVPCVLVAVRTLVVLCDPIEANAIRERCSALIEAGQEVALCYVLPAGFGLHASLEVQRRITSELREALESSAEAIPVFVVSGAHGDSVDDCARAWGATDVQA
jgi:hypothetical protein